MARTRRIWTQFELRIAPGAETWVIVRHRAGTFRIPSDVSILELMEGVQEGWTGSKLRRGAPGWIRIPTGRFRELEHQAEVLRLITEPKTRG